MIFNIKIIQKYSYFKPCNRKARTYEVRAYVDSQLLFSRSKCESESDVSS